MFCKDSQVGKTRVNKVSEGKKSKKTHVQFKKNNKTGLDKLFLLQNELFKEGLDMDEYVDYITDKINNKKYYYKGLNSDNIDQLKKRYNNLINKDENDFNSRGDDKRLNRERRKKFREKKRTLIYNKKRELIDKLLKNMKSSQSHGITYSPELISNDPEKWRNNKLFLFTGGRYIEIQDTNWVSIYSKLVSPNSFYLFDLHSLSELNKYVIEN